MTNKVIQQEISNMLWRACRSFRGAIDSEYKDYILVMLFLKYISDVRLDHYENYKKRFAGDEERIRRRLRRDRFILPYVEIRDNQTDQLQEKFLADYYSLYDRRERANLGELINITLENIELANKAKLTNVFHSIDFNSESRLGNSRTRNHILKDLLEDFAGECLDFRPSRVGNEVIGDVYECLIGKFAAGTVKKAAESYTPPEVSMLIAKLVAPKPGERICDPACGSGSLLLRCAREVGSDNYCLYGQEAISDTWALCTLNMFLHNIDNARIEWADTLLEPKLIENYKLIKFEVVVAVPPFSLDNWGAGNSALEARQFNRWHRGVPPKSKSDYAFISHMVEISTEGTGRVGVVVSHGALFRGGAEAEIRKQLIEENLLDAVIGLPPHLFFSATIPVVIMIFRRDRGERTDVLFIDASREFVSGKKLNSIRIDVEVGKIVNAYNSRESVDKYAYLAAREEIEENDFNLNISRYVDTFVQEKEIDIHQVKENMVKLENELADVRSLIDSSTKGLGLVE